jgi:hypothetical protein
LLAEPLDGAHGALTERDVLVRQGTDVGRAYTLPHVDGNPPAQEAPVEDDASEIGRTDRLRHVGMSRVPS